MRKVIAWILLSIASFQWVGSYFSFQLVKYVTIEHRMTFLENTVSERLHEETGILLPLKAVSSRYIATMGYSNNFIVTEEINGQTYQFLIDDTPLQKIPLENWRSTENEDHQRDVAIFKLILSDFIAQNTKSYSYHTGEPSDELLFFNQESAYSLLLSIPNPPPENYRFNFIQLT